MHSTFFNEIGHLEHLNVVSSFDHEGEEQIMINLSYALTDVNKKGDRSRLFLL